MKSEISLRASSRSWTLRGAVSSKPLWPLDDDDDTDE